MKELKALAKIKVSRCYYGGSSRPASHQLHGFSDTSEHAFAAVIYLRTVYNNGNISIHLVASKARVAPMMKQTIPRLELLGANILARLFNTKYFKVSASDICVLLDRFIYSALLDQEFRTLETVH